MRRGWTWKHGDAAYAQPRARERRRVVASRRPREHFGARLPYRLARSGSAEAAALASAAVEVRRRLPGLMARKRSNSSGGGLSGEVLLARLLSATAEAKTEEEEARRYRPGLRARRRSNNPEGFVTSLLPGLPLLFAAVTAVRGRARNGLEIREGGQRCAAASDTALS